MEIYNSAEEVISLASKNQDGGYEGVSVISTDSFNPY